MLVNSIGFGEFKSEVAEQHDPKLSNNLAFAEQILEKPLTILLF